MKEVIKNHKYLLNNKSSGRQSIKFYEPSVLASEPDKVGTTLEEVLKMCQSKLATSHPKHSQTIKTILKDLAKNKPSNAYI